MLILFQAQEKVQHLVIHFFKTVASNPTWEKATDRGLLDVPLAYDWEERTFITPIVSVLTRQRHAYWLAFHLAFSDFCVLPLEHPAVPKGQSRLRLTFHANNMESEVEGLVSTVAGWAQEMMDLEDRKASETSMPKAARQVYAWMGSTDVDGVEVY